jgi:hypothetical protein|tara:strand:- start:351 stop:461 length:111 start_codon:yes stop_codon:yes gene_type:complete
VPLPVQAIEIVRYLLEEVKLAALSALSPQRPEKAHQ